METPIKKEIVDGLVAELGIEDFAKATIREVKQVAAKSEKASGVEFIKMEMGIPPRDWFDAGHLRIVPHLFTARQTEGYRVVHRPGLPCAEDAAGGDGREISDLRCV